MVTMASKEAKEEETARGCPSMSVGPSRSNFRMIWNDLKEAAGSRSFGGRWSNIPDSVKGRGLAGIADDDSSQN